MRFWDAPQAFSFHAFDLDDNAVLDNHRDLAELKTAQGLVDAIPGVAGVRVLGIGGSRDVVSDDCLTSS
jgi:hypothetical protein